jgi:hypothetical protein
LSLSFSANTLAGDLILVGFDFSASTTPSSVTDSQGNTFTPVGTQLTSPAGAQSVVYYAKNIKGGADTVKVTISANASFLELYLTEYSGIDRTNPIDAQAGASGSAGPVSSGNATTNFAGDVIYGYCPGDWACTAGSGFATRSIFDGNVIEDQTAGNHGSYAATGSATSGWTMHMVALKPASSGSGVSTPAITWAAPAGINYGTALSATQLNASSTVPGTFTYIPAAGTVLKAGSQALSVTFNPTDSTDYTTATATVTLAVAALAPAITWAPPAAISYGTPLGVAQLDASSTVAGIFTYTPAAGIVLKAGSQTLSVKFTPADSTDYTSATATVSLTVTATTPTLTWAAPASIGYGTALSGTQLDAASTVLGTFTYTPASGTVLKVGSQTLSATFTPSDSTDYTTATSSASITVNAVTPTIAWAAPAAFTYETALGAAQLDAASTVPGTFTYTPAAGVVLTAGSQTLLVVLTPTDSTDYTTATAAVLLTVNKTAPSVNWTAPAAILYGTALSAAQLDASSTVAGAFGYTPAAGTVLTAGTQTLSVTFSPTDAVDYIPATSTAALTVNQAAPAITWPAPTAIAYGVALSATQLDATSTVAGSSAYSPAAGTVLTAGSHAIAVTLTPTDSTDYTTATATVTLAVTTVTPAITWAAPAGINYGTVLSATQLNASSTVPGTFTYIPAAGTVLKAGSQALSVTFNPTDSTDYATATATVTLAVNQVTPAISWATPAAIPYGTALSSTQLDASSTMAGTFSYSSAAGTVLTAGSHTIAATFTPTDSTDYATATASVSITVNAATPSITWPTPAAIPNGTALSSTQLDATSTIAGTFVYSPAAGTVLAAGTQTLSVTFTPTDSTDYTTATSSVSITVNAATPTITWAAPAAITYGTALSSTQLDASSTVAGTFSYSPAAGTVLTAGSHAITATFTPTDSTDYATATSSVSITVNAATPAITWAAPAAITYGTALSSTQLDASSTIPGTFVYSPVAGTVLAVGSQTLSVTFTPTDTTDYTTATQTVILTVNSTSSFVQEAASTTSGSANSLTLSFAANTFAGDLILVGFDFSAGTTPSSVTDSQGNTFTPVGTQLTSPAGAQSVVYYAKNITGGADTVTVTISANVTFIELYLTEYSGIDRTNPIDAQAGASGGAGPVSSGNATTNFAGDVIYGYCPGDEACTAGSGFATRSIFDGNVIEDQTSGNPGSYAATGSATSGWTMHMVALKPASSLLVEAPAITSATSASGTVGSAFSYQITATNTPVSYGATGLAAGLTINSGTGLITGTPTTAGTSTATLSATNSAGTGNATLTLTIAAPVPGITSATTASATVGSAFSYQITASNTPSSYGATSLPAGLTVNTSSGLISGTPTAAGTSTVTLSATNGAGTGSATLTLTIAAAGPTLSINATSVGFGNVGLNTPATQSVTLTSTGTAAVTVNSAVLTALTGTGFTFSGPTLPVTLTPTQVATLEVQFDPTAAGAATAQLTITSNSSTNGTVVIPLTGTGTAASYAVDLSWDAPSSSTDPVAGYNVYRAPSGSSMYQLLNLSVDTQTTYVDSTVETGLTYDYIVESVDSSGNESTPTSPIVVTIP